MHIAVVYLGRRGAGGVISLELARQLEQRHQVLAILSTLAENLEYWKKASIRRVEVGTFRNPVGAFLSLVFPFQIKRIANQIRQAKPDVLLFPMFHPWNSLIQKILSDVPSVVFVHDPRPHPDLAGWFYEKLENASIRRASRCVILSETLKPHLAGRGVDSARIDVVPLGPFPYAPMGSNSEKQDHSPTLLFFGRIMPYKGLETLLKAYARVRETQACRLIVAGEGNLSTFRDLLAGLPDVEVVNRWFGEGEVGDFFARSDLVILPYASASQSGVIPIAATFGLPVIATRVGGLSEQVEDGVSGWLVPPENVDALADAIREALTQPAQARLRGQALKARYEKQFGWEEISLQVVKSLELARQARGPK
jgi:glycosyltransferase involved in cell wall biosynthesis